MYFTTNISTTDTGIYTTIKRFDGSFSEKWGSYANTFDLQDGIRKDIRAILATRFATNTVDYFLTNYVYKHTDAETLNANEKWNDNTLRFNIAF